MELKLFDMSQGTFSSDSIVIKDEVFARTFNQALIHQVVQAYTAGARSGTKAQKSRSEVRGGGAKPWRQKGTGRARAGSIRSPIWRGGGVTFAAKLRDYTQKVNKKMYRGAMCAILAELLRSGRLLVTNAIDVTGKTKNLTQQLHKAQLYKVLIVDDNINTNLLLAARNLPYVDVHEVTNVNPYVLVRFDKVLLTVAALRTFEERLV